LRAGPVSRAELARKLGWTSLSRHIPTDVVWLLAAPVAFEQSLAVGKLIDNIDLAELDRCFQEMERDAEALLPEGNETIMTARSTCAIRARMRRLKLR
jgi:hypothetical protein